MLREPPAPPTRRCLRHSGLESATGFPRQAPRQAVPSCSVSGTPPAAGGEGRQHGPSGRRGAREISAAGHHFPPAKREASSLRVATWSGGGHRQAASQEADGSGSPRPTGPQAPPLCAGDSRVPPRGSQPLSLNPPTCSQAPRPLHCVQGIESQVPRQGSQPLSPPPPPHRPPGPFTVCGALIPRQGWLWPALVEHLQQKGEPPFPPALHIGHTKPDEQHS